MTKMSKALAALVAAALIAAPSFADGFLRQSTSRIVRICGVVAVGDGFTPVTTLDLTTADEAEALRDNTATLDISGATWAAITGADGCYSLTLDATATNTVGELVVAINDDSLVLPIWRKFTVVEEAVYDRDFAPSATGIVGTAQTGDSYARLGAPAGASISADIAGVSTTVLQALGVNVTTIATLTNQTSFTLTAGSADDNAYNDWAILVIDASSSVQRALGIVEDYTGATKTVTLRADPGIFTMAPTDTVVVIPAKIASVVAANITQIEGTDATDYYDTLTASLSTFDSSTDGVTLAASQPDYAPAKATDVRDLVVEDQGSLSLGCAMSAILAYAAGDLATSAGNSTYQDPSGTETRITGTVASAGNRTASVTCPTY